MNWAREQVLRVAYLILNDWMREARNPVERSKADQLYYRIQEYKARK